MSSSRRGVRVGLAVLSALTVLTSTGCVAGGGTTAPEVSDVTPTFSATTSPFPEATRLTASPDPSDTPEPTRTGTPTPEPTASSTSPSASPTGTPEPSATAEPALLAAGASSTQVRELQHRLRQLEWFSGPITGTYAAATERAVSGFQAKRSLPASGEVDAKTWDALVSRTRKPSDDEMHNRLQPGPTLLARGSSGDRVRDLQARLKQIAWYSGDVTGVYGPKTVTAVRGFQVRREIPETGEVDQRTLDRLAAMTRTPTRAEKRNEQPKPKTTDLDPRCLTGRAMCVSKRTNSLVWVVDGQPQVRMDVRFGSDELPTREGAFSVGWKSRDHVSSLYKTPMPYAMFFSGGQAVHYSPDFAARGYNGASHGCVNVRNRPAIEALFSTVRVGDKVIIHR